MLYFKNREQAGDILSEELFPKYRYENCAVVALSDGGVVVGERIAQALHCVLTMLLIEQINIPGEDINFGSISQDGTFTSNSDLSSGEMDYYNSEYHGYMEEQKQMAFQRINRLLGDGGIIDENMLRDRVIILVSDGLEGTEAIDAAAEFLKPIRIQKLVVATPLATVEIVDKLHVLADELHILDVKENFMGVSHYYEENNVPSHEETVAKINQIILNWK